MNLFNSFNSHKILYNSSNSLEKEINNFNDNIYLLLVRNDIYLDSVKNDSRIFVFKPHSSASPSIKISNISDIVDFNVEVKNQILLSAYLQYTSLNSNLYVSISALHGFGLYTSVEFLKGQCIFSLNGKIVNENFINNKNFIGEWNAIKMDTYLVRDKRTSYGFINHSRSPNCFIDTNTMSIIAKNNIKENEELLLDYRREPLSKDYMDKFGNAYL